MIDRFNHIGVCVHSIDKTFAWMEKTMGATMLFRKEYPELHQVTAMVVLPDGMSRFELMEPIGNEGTVAAFLEKRGEGFHHISLFTRDVNDAVEEFEASGCRILSHQKGLAFLHPKTCGGILYEISDGTFGKE